MELGVSTQGFRSMAVSSDGLHLAAGDCDGNLHIYNLQTFDYTCFQVSLDTLIIFFLETEQCKHKSVTMR